MPYIFVRGTLENGGLFSNETFIDFQNVEDGNGEFVGAILSRQFGGAYRVTEHKNGYPQRGQQMQWQFQPLAPDTFCTIGVAMQPTVVLNRLEISLRTADAFPVVASLPPRSDDRKCVCGSQASWRSTLATKLLQQTNSVLYQFITL